jgi:hypothetical protein
MIDAKDLTFGIEIETIAPVALTQQVFGLDGRYAPAELTIGHYKNGIQVPYLPQGWTAERDGSINDSAGRPCEIVSPVLKGEDGIAQVIQVLKTLESKGHKVDASCGVHVHIGWDSNMPSDALARLITIVSYCEKGLYAITGTKSRERGRFCAGVRKYNNAKSAKTSLDRDRYHALNLTNLANGNKNTVEFRIFSGSTSATKVVGWIQVCLGLVQRAVNGKRNPNWNPKAPSGGWKKAGEGQSETERLMGYLAWGDCYKRLNNGQEFGWISNAIAQDDVKKEFRRLAKKYDEMP